MASIAVLGEERNILGFKPFGIDIYFYYDKIQPAGWIVIIPDICK